MTKEQLRSYRHIKRELAQIERALEELEAEMHSPRTSRLDTMPRACADGAGPTERLALRHIELTDRYRANLEELRAAQLRIEQAIESLEPTERMLMRHYYLECLTWEEVAVAMNYTWRHVHRIHGKALEKLQEEEKKCD